MGSTASTVEKPKHRTEELKNTLDLVLDTLPIVRELCTKLRNGHSKTDKRHGHLSNVNASMAILESQLRDIGKQGAFADLETEIKDLADHLDQIFRFPSDQNLEYSRLRAVQAAWAEDDQHNTPEYFLSPEAIENPKKWERFLRKLKFLVDEVQCHGDDIDDLEDARPMKVLETDSAIWAFANRAFDAMCCNCHAGSHDKMRLKIGTYKSMSMLQPKPLCILLVDDRGRSEWHEMIIHDHLERKVKFSAESHAGEAIRRSSTSEAVNCVYTTVEKYSKGLVRFDFVLQSNILYPTQKFVDERILLPDTLQEEVNMKALMSLQHRKWPETAKWSLAVMLSYSLYHLYGGSWTQNGWTRDNILFFKSGSRIPLRPFLGFSMKERDDREHQGVTRFHPYPEILELGVILLELHLGQRLEDFLGLSDDLTDIHHIFTQTLNVFNKQKEHIFSLKYRNAIKTCLWPGLELGSSSNRKEFQTMLLQKVVIPLEQELTSNFQEWLSDKDIDEQAAKFDFVSEEGLQKVFNTTHELSQSKEYREASIRPLPQKIQPHAILSSTQAQSGQSGLQYDGTRSENMSGAWASKGKDAELKPHFELFDGEQCTSSSEIQRTKTDQWKDDFKRLMDKHVGSHSDRLKVAILDSGIADHSDFDDEKRIMDQISWIENSTSIDESGHGTHIIGTILEMTKNVDVYVGRISKSRYISETGHIAKAIRHARENQKVDIISLSFGFQSSIRSIQEEIETCIHCGILVFAAASNDGGNSPRAFPARQEGVFCVHSATSEGNKASYNPSPEPGENFSFVGESLKSSWLGGGRKYMSGTSFATPLAISVAAFMYGFICQKIPGHLELPISAKSPKGMQRILSLMKDPRDGYDWISPLKYFKKIPEDKIVADIRHELSR